MIHTYCPLFTTYFSDSVPRYRILLRNQTDSGEGDFIQSLDDNIRFEVKEGTFFYQYEHMFFCYFVFVGLEIMEKCVDSGSMMQTS